MGISIEVFRVDSLMSSVIKWNQIPLKMIHMVFIIGRFFYHLVGFRTEMSANNNKIQLINTSGTQTVSCL